MGGSSAMKMQTHKMTVSMDDHSSHLEVFKQFFKALDDQSLTIEKLPRQDIESYQLQAINAALAHVWERNEYYRAKLEEHGFTKPEIDSLERLADVPMLSKNVIR